MKKSFWPNFSRNIECDKSQGMPSKGPKEILTITVEINEINSLAPKRLLKTQISGRKGNHSSEKKSLTNFSRILSITNLMKQILMVQKVF